ncbi:hypothetical protein GUJ93_ZPchr0011g28116 [Zizania palustris]|uniref:Uncharacterized protein n=1 Tax=Zizania palustris TaxID=103762 RepID=A0A8J6BR03_ZIZPA|nr:hypothetical protein GUJ93_ZPchr0011g28116 [Zizania palustris]
MNATAVGGGAKRVTEAAAAHVATKTSTGCGDARCGRDSKRCRLDWSRRWPAGGTGTAQRAESDGELSSGSPSARATHTRRRCGGAKQCRRRPAASCSGGRKRSGAARESRKASTRRDGADDAAPAAETKLGSKPLASTCGM